MNLNSYVNEMERRDVGGETKVTVAHSGADLVIESLDEFAPSSRACFCGATNAEYIFSEPAETACN